jgi:hypothetical protein
MSLGVSGQEPRTESSNPILNWKRRIQPLADQSIFYKGCFRKFPCAWPAGCVVLRYRTQGSARLIIKLDIPSKNFRRTCSASAGNAASPKALFIKRIHRSRAA